MLRIGSQELTKQPIISSFWTDRSLHPQKPTKHLSPAGTPSYTVSDSTNPDTRSSASHAPAISATETWNEHSLATSLQPCVLAWEDPDRRVVQREDAIAVRIRRQGEGHARRCQGPTGPYGIRALQLRSILLPGGLFQRCYWEHLRLLVAVCDKYGTRMEV